MNVFDLKLEHIEPLIDVDEMYDLELAILDSYSGKLVDGEWDVPYAEFFKDELKDKICDRIQDYYHIDKLSTAEVHHLYVLLDDLAKWYGYKFPDDKYIESHYS